MYLFRVIWGLSFCTTSLLNTFQAITMSPSYSKWGRIKYKLSKWRFPSCFFFWIINLLTYVHIPEITRANSSFTIVGHGYSCAYCQRKQFGNQNSVTYLSHWFKISCLWSSWSAPDSTWCISSTDTTGQPQPLFLTISRKQSHPTTSFWW
jgi:hypothetical protein